MESSAERRLRSIQAHLALGADDSSLPISANPTAGEFFHGNFSIFFFFLIFMLYYLEEAIMWII